MSFTVDYHELEDLSVKLAQVRDEFKNVEDNTRRYDGAMGSGHVVGKLHEFGENWSDKREKLAESLDGVSGAAHAAADAYKQTDEQIATSIADPAQ